MQTTTTDYATTIVASCTPAEAIKAINHIPAWWSTAFEGASDNTGDTFTVTFGETYITIKVIETIPDRKITWHVTDCNKHWLKNKKEWKDTTMSWNISTEGDATRITFTHTGLVPGIECYNGCEKAWNFYINESLCKLLATGTGIPELK